MQVVFGPLHRQKVHYEAPPAEVLNAQMNDFLDWFDADRQADPVVKAGLAHLWFVTLHPFDDGNGRIARAIGDMALARAENSAQRFYSLSAQIQRERKDCYDRLEAAQQGGMDVSVWMEWFLGCLLRAIHGASKAGRGTVQNPLLATLCKCSQDTALCDIADLLERGVLKKSAASGRSTSDELT